MILTPLSMLHPTGLDPAHGVDAFASDAYGTPLHPAFMSEIFNS